MALDCVRNLEDKLLRLDLLSDTPSASAETTVMSKVCRLEPSASSLSPRDSNVLFRYDSRLPTRSRLSVLSKKLRSLPAGIQLHLSSRYLPDNNERRFRSACSPLGVDTSSSSSSESCDPDTDTVLLGMLRAYPGSPCARSDRGFFRRRCDRRSSSTSMALTV